MKIRHIINTVEQMSKIALVTGANRGIGKAIVSSLRADSIRVIGLRGRVDIDLSRRIERTGVIENVIRDYGRIDILVNNAGCQSHNPFLAYHLEDWDKELSLMLTAPFELSRIAGAYMAKQGSGKIINIASIAGIQGTRGVIGYSVAKAGLIQLTKCMSNELAPYGVQVNAIAPGYIRTEMLKGAFRNDEHKAKIKGLIPAQRFGKSKEVAEAVSFLCKSDYITGVCLPVDGGWLAR